MLPPLADDKESDPFPFISLMPVISHLTHLTHFTRLIYLSPAISFISLISIISRIYSPTHAPATVMTSLAHSITEVTQCTGCEGRPNECWGPCAGQLGYCSSCDGTQGTKGACCMRDHAYDPAECQLVPDSGFSYSGYHECVLVPGIPPSLRSACQPPPLYPSPMPSSMHPQHRPSQPLCLPPCEEWCCERVAA